MNQIEEMRAASKALESVAGAIREIEDLTKNIKVERAIRRAAGPAEERAVRAAENAAAVMPGGLDDWAASEGHTRTANRLNVVAIRLKWRADVAERPDDLKDLLAERLERGMAHMPRPLLAALYELGTAVSEIKAGRLSGKEVEERAKSLMDEASAWAERVDEARDVTEDAIVCVAPF